MNKFEGLVYIGLGLFVVGVWFFPFCYLQYEFCFRNCTVLAVLASAVWPALSNSLQTPWIFVAVVGLVLIGMGIYRLVHSLLPIRDEEE
jgi:hypothetical protein